ncbi:unnamed protein product [Prorocentrum cordatum]|uniref:Uncharacterized protein n=1 Tax=Prorocentrum cordatum TaxID=2364126 RepID=A0ABN9TZN4_9DINO|nr:unnamed protein product [Polarella glacialis]
MPFTSLIFKRGQASGAAFPPPPGVWLVADPLVGARAFREGFDAGWRLAGAASGAPRGGDGGVLQEQCVPSSSFRGVWEVCSGGACGGGQAAPAARAEPGPPREGVWTAGPPSMRRAVRSMVCKAALQARERRGRRCFWRAWRAQAATTASMTALWTALSAAARTGTRPAAGPPPVPSPTATSWSIGAASARRRWAAARPWSWRGTPLVPSGPPLRRVPSGASLPSMSSTWPRWLLRLAGRFWERNRSWTSPKAALRIGFCSVSLLSETRQKSKPALRPYCCRREFAAILYHGDCFEVDGK